MQPSGRIGGPYGLVLGFRLFLCQLILDRATGTFFLIILGSNIVAKARFQLQQFIFSGNVSMADLAFATMTTFYPRPLQKSQSQIAMQNRFVVTTILEKQNTWLH